MALVSRKLRLKPGERVVEAGCGWGSLALFMAREHGVHVTAFNISREQIAYAREQARAQGLSDRVEFIEDDYRNVRGACDAFVSVGMLEHVGLPDYATLGDVMDRVLTDDGRGLLHFIGRNRPAPLNPWIAKRIFPGAYPPTLVEVFERILQPLGFSVLDVENIRLHYAKTLEHWRERFLRASDQVTRDVRRDLRARVGPVSRRVGGRVHHRIAAAVPGGVRAQRHQRDSLDADQRLDQARPSNGDL